jgi:hypothetical protein
LPEYTEGEASCPGGNGAEVRVLVDTRPDGGKLGYLGQGLGRICGPHEASERDRVAMGAACRAPSLPSFPALERFCAVLNGGEARLRDCRVAWGHFPDRNGLRNCTLATGDADFDEAQSSILVLERSGVLLLSADLAANQRLRALLDLNQDGIDEVIVERRVSALGESPMRAHDVFTVNGQVLLLLFNGRVADGLVSESLVRDVEIAYSYDGWRNEVRFRETEFSGPYDRARLEIGPYTKVSERCVSVKLP